MANDRLILRCRGCGAWKTIMKYYSFLCWSGYDVGPFVNSHSLCGDFEAGLDKDLRWELVSENSCKDLDYNKQNKHGNHLKIC